MGRGKFSATAFSPTGFSIAAPSDGRYAAMLAQLLPPGRLWRLIPGASTLYALLQGCADELDRLDERVQDLLGEIIPTTSVELLPEYESELQVARASSIAERQARVVAKTIQEVGVRPVDYQTALAPLLGQDPADVVVLERTRAYAIAAGDDRAIFEFFIFRDWTLGGTYFLGSAQLQVNAQQHSHTLGTVIETASMMADDPHSLVDRDLLGA